MSYLIEDWVKIKKTTPPATNRTRAIFPKIVEIQYFKKILSSGSLRSVNLRVRAKRSAVCTLFLLFGVTKRKWNVEISLVEQKYLLKICILCCPDELLTQSLRLYADSVHLANKRYYLGFDLPTKHIKLDNNRIQLLLANISTYPSVSARPSYYRGASAAVFAFSKSDHSFLESAIDHYHEFRQHIPEPTVPVAFIGLLDESEVVTQIEGQSLAQELGADYFEMAVTDLQTLDIVLKSLTRMVLRKYNNSIQCPNYQS